VLFFIERFGPLTRDGLEADKGELVDGVLMHADAMRELFIFSTGDRARRAHIRPAVQPICRNGSDPKQRFGGWYTGVIGAPGSCRQFPDG
jgi:hypothetical protein